jgi:hypothetical protein
VSSEVITSCAGCGRPVDPLDERSVLGQRFGPPPEAFGVNNDPPIVLGSSWFHPDHFPRRGDWRLADADLTARGREEWRRNHGATD